MANLNSYIDIKLPAAPSASDPVLHGELLVLYNSLRNLIADMSESYESSYGNSSAVGVGNSVVFNLLALNLPAGAWDISGNMIFLPEAGTSISLHQHSISLPTESISDIYRDIRVYNPALAFGSSVPLGGTVLRRTVKLSSPTIINLAGYVSFTGTCRAYGFIAARRVAG